MKSIKQSFTRAATGKTKHSTFWLLVLALIILDDDADRREKKKREKRSRQARTAHKKPSGLKPF